MDENRIELSGVFNDRIILENQRCGVYILFYNDLIVYIGSSVNCIARIESHRKTEKLFDSYKIIDADENEMRSLEAKYIYDYVPKYNKGIPKSDIIINCGKIDNKYKIKNREIKAKIINNYVYISLEDIE